MSSVSVDCLIGWLVMVNGGLLDWLIVRFLETLRTRKFYQQFVAVARILKSSQKCVVHLNMYMYICMCALVWIYNSISGWLSQRLPVIAFMVVTTTLFQKFPPLICTKWPTLLQIFMFMNRPALVLASFNRSRSGYKIMFKKI